jgi:hypothetical protein
VWCSALEGGSLDPASAPPELAPILQALAESAAAEGGTVADMLKVPGGATMPGRGSHSSTFQLNLSRFGHTSPWSPV